MKIVNFFTHARGLALRLVISKGYAFHRDVCGYAHSCIFLVSIFGVCGRLCHMKPVTVVSPHLTGPLFEDALRTFTRSGLVEKVIIVSQCPARVAVPGCRILHGESLQSGDALQAVLDAVETEHFLLLSGNRPVLMGEGSLGTFLLASMSHKAAFVYSDFYETGGKARVRHPLNDYQEGSVRNDFDFGSAGLFSMAAARNALRRYRLIPDVKYAALYDLRLNLSIDGMLHHLEEPLYSVTGTDESGTDEQRFAYVDPRNATVQREMEAVFTRYLKHIGAYLKPRRPQRHARRPDAFPVEASVVIPVKNRAATISQAVNSALSQNTAFPFNILVVDNHSTDGTTAILSDLARLNPSVNHIVPARTDLGIGGCWNEAIYSQACGRYAVQLDSDDLYGSSNSLQRLVDMLHSDSYGMVIGAYTIVNERLETIPPGLIDHREWTDENGHNNALRINGLGAPRAFDTAIIRNVGFINASYGEDYAAVLGICRQYPIGRIYDSLYLCRRWSGNTDAALSTEEANRNDAFKDGIRADEIRARQEMNRRGNEGS
jgi:hypothetical protein